MEFKVKTLHHAYLVQGDVSLQRGVLLSQLQKDLNIKTRGNPDVVIATYEIFTIDQARELATLAYRKPYGDRKFFIISCEGLTRETQNALLKLFEEPPSDTHFFLIIPKADILLTTLRSRFQLVELSFTQEKKEQQEAQNFLKASPGKRIVLISKIVEEKDKTAAISFLNTLEELLIEEGLTKKSKKEQKFLKEIQTARSYLYDRSSSVKAILEHIASITSPAIE